MEINNPAGRFLGIIKKGQKESQNISCSQVFAKLFDIDTNDKALLFRRVGELMSLPQIIRSEVDTLENINQALLLKWLTPVEASLESINLKAKWQIFMSHYKDDVIYGMEMCADTLSRARPEKVLKIDDREKLIVTLNDAIKLLQTEDMPEEIKEFFFDRLQRFRDALEAYIILGIKPIESEIANLKGNVGQTRDLYHKTHETPAGRIFWSAIGKVAAVISILSGSLQIGMEVNEILDSNTDNLEVIDTIFESNTNETKIAQIENK